MQADAPRPPAAATYPVSLLVVDLDDFKRINDTYGHVVGDEVLRAVAMAIRGVARADDVVARLGGDEFVVLARGADAENGARLAERVTTAVDGLVGRQPAGAITLQGGGRRRHRRLRARRRRRCWPRPTRRCTTRRRRGRAPVRLRPRRPPG